MTNFLLFGLALGAFAVTLQAANAPLLTPLASTTTPPCSARPGVRAIQSDLVQFGEVSASLSAQSSREKQACTQSAALWVTQKGVSQQFDLPDAGAKTFEILDVAPDSSAILLSSVAMPRRADDRSPQVAAISLNDGAFKWTSVSEMLGFKNCNASFRPQGFLDAKHIEIAVEPNPTARHRAECTGSLEFYSVDLDVPRVKALGSSEVNRVAKAISGPARSCKTDPDVVGACYTARGRLALNSVGEDLLLWPLKGLHYMSVEEQMVPPALRAQLSPETRILATMVLCPMQVQRSGPKPYVCIESATGLRLDPAPAKTVKRASARSASTASNRH